MDLLTVSRRLGHKNITINARFYGVGKPVEVVVLMHDQQGQLQIVQRGEAEFGALDEAIREAETALRERFHL